jgi:hypothetical protein
MMRLIQVSIHVGVVCAHYQMLHGRHEDFDGPLEALRVMKP